MKLVNKLMHPPTTLYECHQLMKEAARENARLRSMLFQFLDGGDTPEFRAKVASVLGVKIKEEDIPTRITDDKMFSSLHDEN